MAAATLAAAPAAAAEGGLVLEPGPLTPVLLGLFLLLVPVVNRLLFRPIFAVLDAREERTEGTRRRAAALAAEAEEILARTEARVRAAREEAERQRREQLTAARARFARETGEARGEAEREIESARAALATEFEQARRTLRAQAEQVAREAAARVLGRPLS